MRIEPMGDAAFVVRDLPVASWRFADAILAARFEGLLDAAPSYDCVGIYFEPLSWDTESLRVALLGLSLEAAKEPRSHTIHVCYEMGEDLGRVAESLGISIEVVVALHSGREYEVFALGFSPGFPYLGWLDPSLEGAPRLDAPRTRVPAGSVGIAGKQTGIYPTETAGGWNLIGRTPLKIADPASKHFPIAPGDRVRFAPIDAARFARMEGSSL